MSADDFFNRWSRKNEEARHEREQLEPAPAPPPPDPYEGRLPTMEDAQALPSDAGIAPFMQQGVDEAVRRSALKKLFTDPHFNVMDGLDIYIGDYTQSDPIPPEMMAMLEHAKGLLDPDGLRDKPVMAMQSEADQPAALAAPADSDSALQATEAQDTGALTAESQAAESQAAESQAAQSQAAESQAAESQAAKSQAAEAETGAGMQDGRTQATAVPQDTAPPDTYSGDAQQGFQKDPASPPHNQDRPGDTSA